MKKLLLILLFLFFLLPCVAFSQPLDMGINAEIGYLTEWDCYIASADMALYINPSGIIGGAVYVGIEVLMDLNDAGFMFAPYRDTYKIGATFNVSVFYVKGEWYCTHPVFSNLDQFYENAYAENCGKISVGWQVNMPYKVNCRSR